MPALRKVFSRALTALVLVAASLVPVVAAATPAQAAVTAAYLDAYERGVVNAINSQRSARGLRPLLYAICPDRYADYLAARLRTSSTLYHQSMTNLLQGCGSTRASENIARVSTSTSAPALVALWMGSSVHRANILDPYMTQIGVGTTCYTMCTTVADFIRR